jgi:hypothetical protein
MNVSRIYEIIIDKIYNELADCTSDAVWADVRFGARFRVSQIIDQNIMTPILLTIRDELEKK